MRARGWWGRAAEVARRGRGVQLARVVDHPRSTRSVLHARNLVVDHHTKCITRAILNQRITDRKTENEHPISADVTREVPLARRSIRRPHTERDADAHILGRYIPAHRPLRTIVHPRDSPTEGHARLARLPVSHDLHTLRRVPGPAPALRPRRTLLPLGAILLENITPQRPRVVRLDDENRPALAARAPHIPRRTPGPRTARLPAARGHRHHRRTPTTRLAPAASRTLPDAPNQHDPQPDRPNPHKHQPPDSPPSRPHNSPAGHHRPQARTPPHRAQPLQRPRARTAPPPITRTRICGGNPLQGVGHLVANSATKCPTHPSLPTATPDHARAAASAVHGVPVHGCEDVEGRESADSEWHEVPFRVED